MSVDQLINSLNQYFKKLNINKDKFSEILNTIGLKALKNNRSVALVYFSLSFAYGNKNAGQNLFSIL